MADDRDWQEEYKKLKVNFDRLDRYNDVLYRYWFWTDARKDMPDIADEAKVAVRNYMRELEDDQRRRSSETPKQEG